MHSIAKVCAVKLPNAITRPKHYHPFTLRPLYRYHAYQHDMHQDYKTIVARSMPSDVNTLNTVSYYVGKSIILFTLFYCSLNWLHYRQLRKDLEDDDNKGKKQ